MSSRALTVVLNYDHSKKFALLLNPQTPPKEDILREARNKFRSKGLSLVYLRGGTTLEDNDDLQPNINQVWVSKGEPYSGPPVDPRSTQTSHSEVRIISGKSHIDETAVKQLHRVGGLQGVRLAVGMPDLHPGNSFPIGCAIACEGVYPALIGSDVGCGIALYRLSSSTRLLNPKKIAATLRGLDEPWSGSVSEWLAKYGINQASPFDASSLGTVGAGNHFAEICMVEKIVDIPSAGALQIREDDRFLLVHTGSRGLGASILAKQTAVESNAYIPPDSPTLPVYLAEHDYAVQWAIANRDLVAYRIKQCLYPQPDFIDGDEAPATIRPIGLEKIVDITHNSVTKHTITTSDGMQDLWVHRKGAAPADQGVTPCPGSRGDFSWLLQPTGDGQYNAHSLAHGAGRRYGRNVLHAGIKIAKSSLTTTALGSEVVCTDRDLLIEERPEAYKDVACIVEDLEERGVCKGVVILRPIVTYKVRDEGRK